MGAKIQDTQRGYIYCEAEVLRGCEIHLDYPSVGATENIMLASVFSDGETYIRQTQRRNRKLLTFKTICRGWGLMFQEPVLVLSE